MMNKIECISGNRAWCFCNFHDDKIRPNLSISLDEQYYGKWRCWACNKQGKLSTTQMKELNLEEHKSYSTKSGVSLQWNKLVELYKNNLNRFPLIELSLQNKLGLLNSYALRDWSVGYDGQAFTIPMYNFPGCEPVGIQRQFPDGNKCCVTGSQLGVMWPEIAYYNCEGPLIICEGFSDAISVYGLGFKTIARPHCHFVNEAVSFIEGFNIAEGSAWRNIIIIPDSDKVGIEGANELEECIDRYIEAENLVIFKYKGAKDIRDYIAKAGREQVTKELERVLC